MIYCSAGLVRVEVSGHNKFDLVHFENGSFDFHNLLPKCSLGIDLSVCKMFFGGWPWVWKPVSGFHGRFVAVNMLIL